jgi:hypothetical protein
MWESPRSADNNCFFKCLQEELGFSKLTKACCNKVLIEFNIELNSPISVSKAIEIFNAKCEGQLCISSVEDEEHSYSDNYEFIKEAIALGYSFDKFVIQNGSIIRACVKNVNLIDLRKHTVGSLSSNLKDWKCQIMKGDFNHDLGNRWSLMDEKDQMECIEYLKADVMGLKELYEKMNNAIHGAYQVNLHKYLSTSQLTYSMWVHHVLSAKDKGEKGAITIPTSDQEAYFRPSVYGGRCYKAKSFFYSEQSDSYLNGDVSYDEIKDYVVDLDVVSLYPAAMEKFVYPIGVPEKLVGAPVQQANGYIQSHNRLEYMGVYHISFKANKQLAHAILPRRTSSGLIWDLHDGEGYYNSVDIDNALENGYKVKISKLGG